MRSIIQIAGVHDWAEAGMLAESGVTHIGFPLGLPHGGEDLDERTAREIIARLPDAVTSVLITYFDQAREIVGLAGRIGAGAVQLHGPVNSSELRRIALANPELFVIKSLVVEGDNQAVLEDTIEATHPFVDAYITDTFDPDTGRSGATGKTHDWSISRRLVEGSPKPVILAGGLTAENVAAAIERARPDGVDAHTGVEGEDGRKDPIRVRRFVDHALQAWRYGR